MKSDSKTKTFTPEFKVEVVIEALSGQSSKAELCRKHIISDFNSQISIVVHERQTEVIELVEEILDAKHTDPEADTSDLEDEIDKLVYELYNLMEDEIAVVEKKE